MRLTSSLFLKLAVRPALDLLPANMNTPEAAAMILAICLQESKFQNRRQIGGPARGFAQFEIAGVIGVLQHQKTKHVIREVLELLRYDFKPITSLAAIENNDVLCVVYSRLLLWTLPSSLVKPEDGFYVTTTEIRESWMQYLEAWRPGKPRYETWPSNYAKAWETTIETF